MTNPETPHKSQSLHFMFTKMEEEEAAAAPIPVHGTKSENGNLPSDSLLQIWCRLPTPSLYRFRSVCHLWNTLITTDILLPNLRHRLPPLKPPPATLLLILRHPPSEPVKHPDRPASLSIRPASHIILRPDPNPPVLTHPIRNGFTPYTDSTLNLLPSSHLLSPLICFSSHLYFYLSNPSINRFLRIAPPQTPLPLPTQHGAFGYFRRHNRYALVNILGTNAQALEFGLGQAGSAKWTQIDSPSPAPVREFGIMVDGFFFWTARTGPGFVVCLDYNKSKFTLIPPPEGNPGEVMLYDQMRLVGFKGAVCAVDNFSRPPRMEVWMLLRRNEEGDEGFYWVRKYNVYMTGMSRDLVFPFSDYYFYNDDQIDEVKKREKNDTVVLCNGTRSRLYSYNLKTRSIKQVYKPKQRSFEQLALYTPGLFPLTIDD